MLKVEYRDHIGFENKRLENEIHSRMTAYRAAMGGEELTMMQSWIIRFLYEHSEEDIYQRDIEAEFSIARSTATGILKLMEKRIYPQSQRGTRCPVKETGADGSWYQDAGRNNPQYQPAGKHTSSGNIGRRSGSVFPGNP